MRANERGKCTRKNTRDRWLFAVYHVNCSLLAVKSSDVPVRLVVCFSDLSRSSVGGNK